MTAELRDAIVMGPEAVAEAIVGLVHERTDKSKTLRMAFDGWSDVDWKRK